MEIKSIPIVDLRKNIKVPKEINFLKLKKMQSLFKIGRINKYVIIYSPLIGKLYLIDNETYKFLNLKRKIPFHIIKRFIKNYLFVNNLNNFLPKINIEDFGDSINIFPTTNCNLSCRYCYANAQNISSEIDFDFVKIATNYFIKNYKKKYINIYFHGGGEPTLAFDLIKRIIEYVQTKNKKTKIYLSSNGVFSNEVLNWILDNDVNITLSCDGPPEIQDLQRPLNNGNKSSPIVENSLKMLGSYKNLTVRTTISAFSVNKQTEIIEYFHKFNIKNIHIEPLYKAGRSLTDNSIFASPPNMIKFANSYLKAKELAEDYGIFLRSSFLPLTTPKSIFCGLGGIFALTTDGFVSTCYEVTLGYKGPKEFIIGNYDKSLKRMVLNKSRLNYLRKRTIYNMKNCYDCFLKWNCSGDCAMRLLKNTGDIFRPINNRCGIKKKIVKKYLLSKAKKELRKK